jgi:urate oxidase
MNDDPMEDVEDTSQELMKQVMENGGVSDDTAITMSGKQLNTLVVAVSAGTAKVYTEKINQLTENFKEEMKTYVATEFIEEFKHIDDVLAALERIDKLERSITIIGKHLDQHAELLNTR